MAILVDDSVEKIMSVYDAALDLSGFARLRPAPQGCRVGERSAGSVLAAVPLVLTQHLAQMGLIPDKRAAEEVAAKVLPSVDTDQPEGLISVDWPSILGSSYPIAHEHTNCASLLHVGGQVPSDILLPHGIHQNPVGNSNFGRFHVSTPIQRERRLNWTTSRFHGFQH